MLNQDLARELTARLREGLAERGDFGRFLLDRIDEAVSRGVEEREDAPETIKQKGSRKQVITRRPATDEETLRLHLRVLNAYVSEIPAIASRAESELRERFNVGAVVLAIDPDEAQSLKEDRVSEIRVSEVVNPSASARIREAAVALQSILDEAARDGVEAID